MTKRKESAMYRELGKISLSMQMEQAEINAVRKSVAKKRKLAEEIGRKLLSGTIQKLLSDTAKNGR